jgi:hypothetical protein
MRAAAKPAGEMDCSGGTAAFVRGDLGSPTGPEGIGGLNELGRLELKPRNTRRQSRHSGPDASAIAFWPAPEPLASTASTLPPIRRQSRV